jgi:hypothetical protein
MRTLHRTPRLLVATLALVPVVAFVAFVAFVVFAGSDLVPSAAGTVASNRRAPTTTTIAAPPASTSTPVAVAVLPAGPVFATGNEQLDALLPTLPAVLFEGGAQVRFGYNPVDCCHAGGYNPGLNEVWVSEKALGSVAAFTYVTVHELAHSVHLDSARAGALTAAVVGAPVVRAGSPWDDSEKVADCVAWALYPAETAASGVTYWDCPDPWRAHVVAALQ